VVTFWDSRATSLTVALAVGLLIGLDREKHKNAGSSSSAAGVRTFTLVALLGAMVALLHSDVMIIIAGAGVVLLMVTASTYVPTPTEEGLFNCSVKPPVVPLLGFVTDSMPLLPVLPEK
jgi:hypothetical protein